jgi:hypothetical protein
MNGQTSPGTGSRRQPPFFLAIAAGRRAPRSILWAVVALLLLTGAAGCTAGPGGYLATLVPGTLSAQLPAGPARLSPDGWLLQSGGAEFSLNSLDLNVSDLVLSGAPDDGAPDAFLAAPVPLLALPVMGDVPVAIRLPGSPLPGVPLSACMPGCQVDGTVFSGGLFLQRITVTGSFRPAGTTSGPGQGFLVNVSLLDPSAPQGVPLLNGNSVALSRDLPATLQLSALVTVDAGLFDGLDFASLPQGGGLICLGLAPGCSMPPPAAALSQLRANLSLGSVQLELSDASAQAP